MGEDERSYTFSFNHYIKSSQTWSTSRYYIKNSFLLFFSGSPAFFMCRLRANSSSWYLQEKCIVLNSRHMPWEELLFLIKPIWSGSMIRGHNFFKWKASSLKRILQSALISDQGLQGKQKSESWPFLWIKSIVHVWGEILTKRFYGERERRFWCTGQNALECVGLIAAFPFFRCISTHLRVYLLDD